MRFRIRHSTRFEYEEPAYASHNELRLRPSDGAGQKCLAFDLTVDQPAAILEYTDFFANHAHSLSISPPHETLTIVAESLIERIHEPDPECAETPFAEFLIEDKLRNSLYYEFLNSSRFVPFSERLRKFFWMAVRPGDHEDVAAYVMRVVAYVRDQFEYETTKTNVSSSLNDILKSGGGVCQDFAHLTIGLLRLAGVPARYVSGYLAPAPPSPANRDLSQQASHAWLEAWLPHLGWTAYDPTHRCRADNRHLKIAIGRDYADVPPLKGVYRSDGAKAEMTVMLNVEPADFESSSGGSTNQNGNQSQQ
jgi:transglutaminase-like putative cysteine protease